MKIAKGPRNHFSRSYSQLHSWWQNHSPHPDAALAVGGYRGGWWPGRSALEVMVTAILVQNTRWENVARAAALLRDGNLLPAADSPKDQAVAVRAIHNLTPAGLEPFLRPAGCASVKARRVWNLMNFLMRTADADVTRLQKSPTHALREALLSVHGIGPETADSILLYALNRPAFPIDAYLRRVGERHRLLPLKASAEELRSGILTAFDGDVAKLHRYHALIVEVAKRHCARRTDCLHCPLRDSIF